MWSLLPQAKLSFRVIIVIQKSYSADLISLLLKKRERKYFFLHLILIYKRKRVTFLFIIPWEKYLVTFLGAGWTKNDFYYQQCNLAERER